MSNNTLLGVCGLYCGACNHYHASLERGKHLLDEAVLKGRKPEEFTCKGCRSEKLYIHPGCKNCKIRDCAKEKDIDHCGLCLEFPCSMLKDFQFDGHKHHIDIMDNLRDLKSKGCIEWLKEQERRWECSCGEKYSWYEGICVKCGSKLTSYAENNRDS